MSWHLHRWGPWEDNPCLTRVYRQQFSRCQKCNKMREVWI